MTVVAGTSTDQLGNLIDEMDIAEANGGGVVTLPEGDILFAGPIPYKQFVHVRGSHTDATRCHFEGTGYPYAFDLLGPGASGGAYPNDRAYSGVSNLTIIGAFPTGSTTGGIRLGNNHRSVDLVSKVNIKKMPGDGILHAADSWNTKLSDIQIHACAFGGSTYSGWRMLNTVGDLNFFDAEFITVEGCGNANAKALYGATGKYAYSNFAPGIRLTGKSGGTNRGINLRSIQSEGNFGVIQFYAENLRKVTITTPYIEALAGVVVGMELANVTGTIIGPSFDAATDPSGVMLTPTKALKLYGSSRVTLIGYERGGAWSDSDLETNEAAVAELLNPSSNLRKVSNGATAPRVI